MDKIINIDILGDSILKGVQVNPVNKKYFISDLGLEILNKKYSVQIKNYSSFGCTVTKGNNLLKKLMEKNIKCDAIIMDYGGNDCDYNWKEISENPEGNHIPNTPMQLFTETYLSIIDTLKEKGILPILTTLPPLEPERFFEWFCKDLNKKNVLKWLGEINNIYRHQESYSKAIEQIATEKQVPVVDLRGAFLKNKNVKTLLCEDGTHPNSAGQRIITASFCDFADKVFQ